MSTIALTISKARCFTLTWRDATRRSFMFVPYVSQMSQGKVESFRPQFPWLFDYIPPTKCWEVAVKRVGIDTLRTWVDVGTWFHNEYDEVFLLDANGACIGAVGCSVKRINSRTDKTGTLHIQKPKYKARKHFIVNERTIEEKLCKLTKEEAEKVVTVLWISHKGQMHSDFFCRYEFYTSVTIYKSPKDKSIFACLPA